MKNEKRPIRELHPGKLVHDSLSDRQVEVLKIVYRHFAHYSYESFERFELEFLRESDPEAEIAVWKQMAIIFRAYCTKHAATKGEEKDIHDLIIQMSLGLSPDDPRCEEIERVATQAALSIERFRRQRKDKRNER